MKVICRGRGSGKTTELVKDAAKNGYTIICKNRDMKLFVIDMAKKLNLKIPEPITMDDLNPPNRYKIAGKDLKYAIDDAGEVLERMWSLKIHELTISSENWLKMEKECISE